MNYINATSMTLKRCCTVVASLIGLGIIVSLYSCSDDPGPNWFNYELYVNERDRFPAFSPDGQHIAYYHNSSALPEPAEYPSGLYIIDRNGNNRVLVIEGHHQDPAWSPDGKWLVFSSQGTIQKCKTDGDSLTSFVGLDSLDHPKFYFPDWSADGKYIVFDKPFRQQGEQAGGIFYATSDFKSFGSILAVQIPSGRDPELSPDGRFLIYYDWMSGNQPSEIFLLDVDDSSIIRLTDNGRDDRGATWSYDGLQIAWSSDVRIHIMNADGGNQRFMTYGQYPSWSVNDEIVFSHANADYSKEVLYIIDSDGSNKRQITF